MTIVNNTWHPSGFSKKILPDRMLERRSLDVPLLMLLRAAIVARPQPSQLIQKEVA